MPIRKVDTHLHEKLVDPYFKELYELEQQKLAILKQIISYRIKHKLTQEKLAKKAGVTQQHISKIENGEFSSIVTLEKILLFIGFTVKITVVPLKTKTKNSILRACSQNKLQTAQFVRSQCREQLSLAIIAVTVKVYKVNPEVLFNAVKKPLLGKKTAVYLLKRYSGLTNQEIGAMFGISYQAVSKINKDMQRIIEEEKGIKKDIDMIMSHFKG